MTCENNSIVADILMRCLSTCELNHGYLKTLCHVIQCHFYLNKNND